MKKLLYCASALAMLLFAGSCQKEKLEPEQTTDGKVTFTIEVPAGVQTKADIGDGTNVDQLIYEVWLTEGTAQKDLSSKATRLYHVNDAVLTLEDGKRKATLELDLMNDQNFTILFWAQKKDKNAYVTDKLTEVTYKNGLDTYVSNDEDLAAFYAAAYVVDGKHVDTSGAPADPTVTLRRPFAQLNLGTLNTTTQYPVTVEKSDVKITNVPTVFNVSTKEVSVPKVISFQTANVPTNPTDITVQTKVYDYVAMNYVFAGDNAEVEYNIHTKVGGTVDAVVNNVVKNVPLKENHRTNIIGNLLTSKVDYQIVVDKQFKNPDIDLESVTDGLVQVTPDLNSTSKMYEISTGNGFAHALMEIVPAMNPGDNYEFYIINSIDLSGINYVAPTLKAGTTVLLTTGAAPVTRAASEITISGLDSPIFAKVEDGATLTFSDIVVEDHAASAALVDEVESGANVMVHDCEASDSADADVPLIGSGDVVDINEGVSTLEQLQAALRTNATEIEVVSTIEIAADETVVLDLNGKTVWQEKECTESYNMFANKGNLTIKGNGIIRFEDLSNGGGTTWGSYIINNTGELTIENGTLEHLGTADDEHDTSIPIQNYAGKVVINGGIISSPEFRTVRDYTAGGEIIINGGVFNGQVWMQGLGNGPSTLTINGGEFSPVEGYDGSSVYITNGTNDVNVSITGGYFKTKIGCAAPTKEGVKGAITGGTFTTAAKENTNAALLAEGYTFLQEGELWTVYNPEAQGISNAAQMFAFAKMVNSGNNFKGKTVKLNADIDLDNVEWISIGTPENNFSGIFDGDNHTVKNLNVVVTEGKEDKAYIGFFGYANNATIKNVIFENVNLNIACLDIDHSQGHIGAVAGSLEGTSTIENVTVKGDIKVEATFDANGASRVAVVAGGNSYGNVTMKNVHVNANQGSYLKANNNVGALAGQLQGKSVFENCSSNINVIGKKFFAGGIIGLAAGDQTFVNCHTTGDITITAGREGRAHDQYRVGGIAGGWADNAKTPLVLDNCTYTGKISGKNADGAVADPLDYAGYVGRGYTLAGVSGSTVVIDGKKYVNISNTSNYVFYVVDDVLYMISSSAALVRFAEMVNIDKNSFSGKTVVLTSDIDLNNQEWTPIGQTGATTFDGVFDGQNYTISNLKVNSESQTGAHYSSGLFGWVESHIADHGHIKNVKIDGANITGHHNCGALVGYITQETALVENCHVTGATISCTHANNDADGDKAGALIGNATVATPVKNCTAAKSTVSAGRDAGQVIGAGKEANVTGCSATDVTVTANGTSTGANVRNEVIGRLL